MEYLAHPSEPPVYETHAPLVRMRLALTRTDTLKHRVFGGETPRKLHWLHRPQLKIHTP